ncbi:ComEC/Rec2 family competence protein, partial [bacterium]|nr:ComEC/Rec2 family competence protein [bacterium]
IKVLSDLPGGAWWYRFALYLRVEFLKVIKQTMPFPESSFLGGVVLGLKGGLPNYISKEFRQTGVSHVLAVSGLHVTIIAGLLYGLFTLFRVPIKIFAPFIVFFLFTFALIVGWPSSAVRAALMNSLFVLSRAYLKERGFRLSIIFALAVAAVAILTFYPLQLTEPSFTLSFMAIYALAMFSEPSEKLLTNSLRGAGLVSAVFMIFTYYFVVIIWRSAIVEPWFFPFSGIYFLLTYLFSKWLAKKSSFVSYSFEMIPGWLKSFTSSQVAIFFGMMGPLSAFYFGSMSLSSPIANMIAIPLIGIIVQVGLVAGIIGTIIPVLGIKIALMINAANWLAVKFFLGMAHFFSILIPFPRVSQPSVGSVVVYYGFLHLFFFWDSIKNWSIAIYNAISELLQDPDYKWSSRLAVGVATGVSVFFLGFWYSRIERLPDLRVTLLDVGYGSSLLIEKGSKTMLVDSGLYDSISEYDIGERVILPALSEKNIRSIDSVVLTSPLPERVSGLLKIFKNYKINKIYTPFSLPNDGKEVTFSEFVAKFSFGDSKIEENFKKDIITPVPPNPYLDQAYSSYNALIKAVKETNTSVVQIFEGIEIDDFKGTVRVAYPEGQQKRFSAYYDGTVILINEGDIRMAYSPGNAFPWADIFKTPLHLLMVSDLPYNNQEFDKFMAINSPVRIAISFRKPPRWLMENYYMNKRIDIRTMHFNNIWKSFKVPAFRTDRNGAIQIDIRSGQIKVKPFVESEEHPK